MTSNDPKWREFIPLYVNGSLSASQRQAFEQALADDPGLQSELDEFRLIGQTLDELPMPDDAEFDQLFRRIESSKPAQLTAPQAVTKQKTGLFEGFRQWLVNPFLAWGVAAAQFIVLALVLVNLLPENEDARYQTLSQTSMRPASSINLVFQPSATMAEISELLRKQGLHIVNGPGVGNHFVVASDTPMNLDSLLEQLRQTDIIRFAEKNLTE